MHADSVGIESFVRCRNCHHSLEGLAAPEHRCPSCGTPFDLNDPTTWEAASSTKRFMIRWQTLLVFIAVAGSVALLYFLFRNLIRF